MFHKTLQSSVSNGNVGREIISFVFAPNSQRKVHHRINVQTNSALAQTR